MPDLRMLPTDQIDDPPDALRRAPTEASIEALAQSILSEGQLQPIGVVAAGDRFRLVWGHRRLLAHRFMGRTSIEAKVFSVEERRELSASLAENVQRRDLTPVEEARACRAMVDGKGMTVREIGLALGKSDSWVRARLEILTWPEDVLELVAREELSPAVARELILVEHDRMRAHYVRAAVENGVTAQMARAWRLEYETARSLGNIDAAFNAPELACVPLQPARVLCQVCDQPWPVTGIAFVKTCPGCVETLAAAKRAS